MTVIWETCAVAPLAAKPRMSAESAPYFRFFWRIKCGVPVVLGAVYHQQVTWCHPGHEQNPRPKIYHCTDAKIIKKPSENTNGLVNQWCLGQSAVLSRVSPQQDWMMRASGHFCRYIYICQYKYGTANMTDSISELQNRRRNHSSDEGVESLGWNWRHRYHLLRVVWSA